MGYNGSNRRGYDVKYQGFKKSSRRTGDKLFNPATKLTVAAGASLFSSSASIVDLVEAIASTDFSRRGQKLNIQISKGWLLLIITTLLLSVLFLQYLCYLSFLWGWFSFFSFLLFGSLSLICIGAAEYLLDTSVLTEKSIWLLLACCVLVVGLVNIAISLWPFWLVEYDLFVFVHILVIFQILACIYILSFVVGTGIRIKKERLNQRKQ